ncbi:MAG: lamin tail domain-containing protein [Sedimentisphaerales bacterium]|nr:lamin tail domain-containing protein [Sedimentisphaerales bacterium]
MEKSLITRRIVKLACLLLTCAAVSAALASDCPIGDLNGDCKVNLLDLGIMGENWLDSEPDLPLETIVINEVMAHSHGILPDWLELYNTSGVPVNLSGWYISDSDSPLTKYKIPNGTIIPAHGYITFNQNDHFGIPHGNPTDRPFLLSENGETVYLSFPDIVTNPQHVCDDRKFGASARNISLGRYTNSTGDVKFVAMDANTPGAANSGPKVGPIVISEIMYDPIAGSSAEYIELHNTANYTVYLQTYDPCVPGYSPWKFTEGPEYEFPPGTPIHANGYAIVARDPAAFTAAFGAMPPDVNVYGPFEDDTKLSNDGENVEISMPGELEDPNEPTGDHVYVRIDNVRYSDGSQHKDWPGLDPWPKGPDNNGESLNIIDPNLFGDDVENWEAGTANPGT